MQRRGALEGRVKGDKIHEEKKISVKMPDFFSIESLFRFVKVRIFIARE